MNIQSCFKIAYVKKTHGLKGEVTLSLLPECPSLGEIKSLFVQVDSQLVPYFIESASVKGTQAYVKLEGIQSPEAAIALKGCSLYLPKSLRPDLPKGKFYHDEIVGFEVIDSVSGTLGTVHEILETGVNRHVAILRDGKEVLIPMNGPFIKSINKSKKQIRVELPDGLLEL
jgi:16S rRNA processing protein RimM